MSKSSQSTTQKSRKPRQRTINSDIPEDLPEALSWLRKLLGTIYSMNIEGITRLKTQFDQIFDDHVSEFDSKIGKIDLENPKQFQRYLYAKDILGHILAVCKYLERIMDVKKLTQGSSSRKQSTESLADSLQKELTSELRTFSERLEQTQGILVN
ncbi:MAG: hypothetical protein ACFFBU_10010 [Promethearchaeota archaeon]